MQYGYEISWTPKWGEGMQRIREDGFTSRSEMEQARRETIERIGWTPPKWWQWWRMNDCPRSL